jgi:hypothetical protein
VSVWPLFRPDIHRGMNILNTLNVAMDGCQKGIFGQCAFYLEISLRPVKRWLFGHFTALYSTVLNWAACCIPANLGSLATFRVQNSGQKDCFL